MRSVIAAKAAMSYRRQSAGRGDVRHEVTADAAVGFYPEWMLDLGRIDVEEIATALADQTDYEHRWLIDPRTGEVVFWTSDTGIDGENPVDIDELDLIVIDPLPPYVWYQDMVDFAAGISDSRACRTPTPAATPPRSASALQRPSARPRHDQAAPERRNLWSKPIGGVRQKRGQRAGSPDLPVGR